MSSHIKIVGPSEDTITAMAHRAYEEFRRQEQATGAKMRKWEDVSIQTRVFWKNVMGEGLGRRGTLVNVNPVQRDPWTLLVTGLSEKQMLGMRAGIEAKLGGTAEAPAMNYSDKAWDEELVQLDGEPDENFAIRVGKAAAARMSPPEGES